MMMDKVRIKTSVLSWGRVVKGARMEGDLGRRNEELQNGYGVA